MKKRSIEQLELDALKQLETLGGLSVRCGYLGDLLFRENIKEKGHHRGSAPYARITGKILKRLEKNGFVRVDRINQRWGWVLTDLGRERARQ